MVDALQNAVADQRHCCPVWWARFIMLWLTKDIAALCGGTLQNAVADQRHCCPVWWARFRMLWLIKDIAALCGGHASECCG